MGLVSKQLKRKNRSISSAEDESDLESEKDFHEQDTEDDEDEDEDEDDDDDAEDVKGDEAQKDAEMEELEKEYTSLRHGEQNILMNLKRHTDEDLLKGQAVKNQQVLWDKTLELRFLLQKAFSSSNKLPQEPLRSSFCGSDEAVDEAYSDLITSSKKTLDCLVELQEALLEKNPSIIQVTEGSKKGVKSIDASTNSDLDEAWSRVQQLHSRIAPFRDSSIDKWQRKSQVTTGVAGFKGKFQAFSQNISEQVAAYMRDPSRMIKRMQLRRPFVGVFGAVMDVSGNIKEENAIEDGDPELLDDSEFYQRLLREFFEFFNPTTEFVNPRTFNPTFSEAETDFYARKRRQTKKRKIVDRRASKSRKIRYHVHEKIVNFMAPERNDLPDMAPILFENLFGRKHPKSAPVA